MNLWVQQKLILQSSIFVVIALAYNCQEVAQKQGTLTLIHIHTCICTLTFMIS